MRSTHLGSQSRLSVFGFWNQVSAQCASVVLFGFVISISTGAMHRGTLFRVAKLSDEAFGKAERSATLIAAFPLQCKDYLCLLLIIIIYIFIFIMFIAAY
jgi:hypothetical protein